MNNWNFNYCLNNLPTHYRLGLHNHENFFYANPRNSLQPPSWFQQLIVEKKPSIEVLLSTFIVETRGRFNKYEEQLDNIETYYTNMNASMKSLEMQLGQIANESIINQRGNSQVIQNKIQVINAKLSRQETGSKLGHLSRRK